jgi:uncharacterized protein YhfF
LDITRNFEAVRERLRARGIHVEGAISETAFGDSAALSESLIALIRAGRKSATCSLLWSYAFDQEPLPRQGQVCVVTHMDESLELVIRTTHVAIHRFDEVDAAFAAQEGEGDLSLEYWHREHWRFFAGECARIGREAGQSMPLVCEQFEVLLDFRAA